MEEIKTNTGIKEDATMEEIKTNTGINEDEQILEQIKSGDKKSIDTLLSKYQTLILEEAKNINRLFSEDNVNDFEAILMATIVSFDFIIDYYIANDGIISKVKNDEYKEEKLPFRTWINEFLRKFTIDVYNNIKKFRSLPQEKLMEEVNAGNILAKHVLLERKVKQETEEKQNSKTCQKNQRKIPQAPNEPYLGGRIDFCSDKEIKIAFNNIFGLIKRKMPKLKSIVVSNKPFFGSALFSLESEHDSIANNYFIGNRLFTETNKSKK